MKLTISCVYWILLLISVVSSGLLFIIVASEGIKVSKDQTLDDNKEHFGAPANVTIDDSGGGSFDPPNKFRSEIKPPKKIATAGNARNLEKKETNLKQELNILKNGVKTENIPGLELFPEGLTQQPNLSQGVPETDQAVVLTLVDAAAAELQSLAQEPRISLEKLGTKSVVNNLTIAALRDSEPSQLPSPSRLPTLANLDPENSLDSVQNLTNDDDQLQEIQNDSIPHYEDQNIDVVIVRADQSGTGTEIPSNILINEDDVVQIGLTTTADGIETTSELPEIEARARLTGSAAEDASLMLDVLVTGAGTDPHEDIPSFSEWAQKRLEEAEKKKTHPNASVQNPGGPGGRGTGSTKVRSKNYASPDCGSKIVAANPEAGSASSVLSSSRDEYMLNTCTSRVWFVVELCEAIQAEKIELANFELFSSSPQDFSVFVGDRFPSRDWSAVGQFTAKDERDIQSFALHPRLFGKFIKVELHSHYGSEHFCPVSLFRVYGTSEFEVLETENQIQESNGDLDDDDDEEEMLDVDSGDPPRNLFGSARDAVLSIVKKAAEVLVKSGDTVNNNTKIQESIEDTILQNSLIAACMTPKYSVLCSNCTETMFAKVFQLVSCNDQYLASLLRIDFINKTLCQTRVCHAQGVRIKESHEFEGLAVTGNDPGARFLTSLFPPEYLVALCNVLAAKESRVIVNTSYYVTGNNSEGVATLEDALITPPQGVPTTYEASTASASQQAAYCTAEDNSPTCRTSGVLEQLKSGVEFSTQTHNDPTPPTENIAALIKPTKTLTRDDRSGKELPSHPVLEPSRKPTEESTFFEAPASPSSSPSLQATIVDKIIEESGIQGTAFETASHDIPTSPSSAESNPEISDPLGDLGSGEAVVPESEPETEPEREQEVKITSQDQISLDTLLSDLKDLEADSVTMQNNPAAPSATLSQPTPTPQQKESVFLRLSNRIKTLERNMSLSGQYLEELSKRYKKQVEEMQRSLERAIAAMGEESRRGEEREARRLEEIIDLQEQVATLTRSLSALLNDRDSWRSKFSLIGQHVVLVCVEIVIVLLVLSYCRRTGELEDEVEGSITRPKITRRKSVEGTTRKTKKRRPSEIASHISGTYRELLIHESVTSNEIVRKERKRKRKREHIGKVPVVTISDFPTIRPIRRESLNALPGGTNFPTRRASSSDASKIPDRNLTAADNHQRPESAPENCSGWFSDQKQPEITQEVVPPVSNEPLVMSEETSDPRNHGIERITESKTSFKDVLVKGENGGDTDQKISVGVKPGGILKNRNFSSPAFIKTALGSRSKRLLGKSNTSAELLPMLKSDNWEWYSKHSGSRSSQEDNRGSPTPSVTIRIENTENVNGSSSVNGRHEDSDDSRSGSATPTSGSRKDKKSYGLKKMVRKFF